MSNWQKKEYTPQKYITLKYNELNEIPWEDRYSGVVNVFSFSLKPLIPYHQSYMSCFDFLIDIEDISSVPPGKKLVRVASKL